MRRNTDGLPSSLRITRHRAGRLAAVAAIALTAGTANTTPAGAAGPPAPTPETIATGIGGDVRAADIEHVEVSPDGARVLYRRTEHRSTTSPDEGTPRAATGDATRGSVDAVVLPSGGTDAPVDGGDAAPVISCSDVWVARLDGSATTRLSDVCESNPAYGPYTSNEQWSPDGAVTYFSNMTGGHSAGVSHRWTATTPAGGVLDGWADETFRGAGTGYTADGRFWILRVDGWAYATTEWTAVRVATGTTYPVWDEARQGEGHWSTACRSAPAPQRAPSAPTFDEVLTAMSGSEPACGFVPRPQPSPSAEATPTPVRPTGPSAGVQVPLPEKGVVLPQRAATASSTGPMRTPLTPDLRIRSFTASIPAALDRGANVKFEARSAVSAKAWLIVESHAARRSGRGGAKLLKPGVTIARGSVTRLGIGVSTLPLRIDPAARRSLKAAGTLRGYVRVITTDATGATTKAERTVVLTP